MGSFVAVESDICSFVTPSAALSAAGFAAGLRRQSEVSVVLVSSSRSVRAEERAHVRWIAGFGKDGQRKGRFDREDATLTVPRNHELMTPGHVSPLSSTLIPPVNTAVFAAAAGTRPGLGLARNAGIVSRNGGSAAEGAGDRRVRWGPFSLDEVPTGDASGDADATRGVVLEDGAGVVAHLHRVAAADVAIVVIEPTPPSCCAVRRTLLAFVK